MVGTDFAQRMDPLLGSTGGWCVGLANNVFSAPPEVSGSSPQTSAGEHSNSIACCQQDIGKRTMFFGECCYFLVGRQDLAVAQE